MNDQHLFLRNDTFLGVCEAIGRDFGFHPNWLRIALAVAIFFAPTAVLAGYVALGVVIALVRWAFPVPSDVDAPAQATVVEAPALGEPATEEEQLPLAA